MNYPWYSWLSVIGVLVQFFRDAYKILIQARPLQLSNWFSYVGTFLILIFGLLILPTVLLLFLMDFVMSIKKELGTAVNFLILLYIYCAGVFVVRKLYSFTKISF